MNLDQIAINIKAQILRLLDTYPELMEDEVLRADVIEGETDIKAILASFLDKARESETMQEAIKIRIDAMSARKARYQRHEEGLRTIILSLLETMGMKTLALPEATLSISTRKPKAFVSNIDALPAEYVITETVKKVDKDRLKEALDAGGPLPAGVSLDNGGRSLTVRTR